MQSCRSDVWVRVVSGAVVVLMLAGCSSQDDQSEPTFPQTLGPAAEFDPAEVYSADGDDDQSIMSDAQRSQIADGVVTYDEYKSAVARLNSCIEAKGYEIVIGEETNQIVDMRIPDAAESAYDECYGQELGFVDNEWRLYRANFGAQAEYLAECLREIGVEPGVSYMERGHQLEERGYSPAHDCIQPKQEAAEAGRNQ